MKKLILPLVFTILSFSFAFSQEFNVGTNIINAGVGFGGNFGSFTTSSQTPGYSISYERGVWDIPGPGVVSLGAYLGTKTYKYNFSGGSDKWTYTIVGVRGAYHYNGLNIENLDVYGGLMVSYNILSFTGARSFGSKPGATGFIGGRWFFAENFAVFAEAGYGVAYLSVGVSIRL